MKRIKSYKQFNEDHAQMSIPFKEPEFKGKTVHEDLEDALWDLRVMHSYKSYHSVSDPDTEIEKHKEGALSRVLDGELENDTADYYTNFMYYNSVQDNPELYSKKFKAEIKKEEIDDPQEVAEYGASNFVMKEMFSREGLKKFMAEANNRFEEDIYEMVSAVKDSYDEDDQGLISIWRTVDYAKGDDGKDIYDIITKEYGGVGVFWTWDEKSAEAYWGNSAGHKITLHAKVSVEDVDWGETVYKNAYGLKEEKEIRVKDGAKVMMIGYHDDVIDKDFAFEEPIVVKAGRA